LNLLTAARIQENSTYSQICGILTRQVQSATVLASTNNQPYIFQITPFDNPSVTLDRISDITQISLKITTEDMTTVFANMPNYVCILSFEKLEGK
jgi:hypothetical protein